MTTLAPDKIDLRPASKARALVDGAALEADTTLAIEPTFRPAVASSASIDRARIFRAKTTAPRARPAAVDRASLSERLQPDRLADITVIAAPAGYGKTTAVAAAFARMAEPWRLAWLSVDRHDNGALPLARGIMSALHAIDPRLAQGSSAILDHATTAECREALLHLCDDIEEAGDHLVLVIDDWQWVSDAAAHALIEILMDHLPGTLRLVIASRSVPDLPLAGWRAKGRLCEIDQTELRFSEADSIAFLRRTMALALPESVEREWATRSGGWIAGLQMAALSAKAGGTGDATVGRSFTFDGSHRFLHDYMTEEVLAALPADARAFLQVTSILHSLNPALCDAVTLRSDSAAMLAWLDHANVFITRLDDSRQWFQYHPLFQEALDSELDAATRFEAHRRAAAWYRSHHLHREALRHHLPTGDIDGCADAMHHLFEEMLCRGEVRDFDSLLQSLPPAAFDSHPELEQQRLWIGCLTGAHRTVDRGTIERLQSALEANPRTSRAMHTFRAYLALNWGDASEAERWAVRTGDRLQASSSYFEALSLTYLGQAQAETGCISLAVGTLRQAHYVGERTGNGAKSLDALVHLVQLLLPHGRLEQARILSEAAVAKYQDRFGRPLPIAGMAHASLGAVRLAADDVAGAVQAYETAAELSRRIGMVYFSVLALCGWARALHIRGDRPRAWAVVGEARELAEASGGERRLRMIRTVVADLLVRENHAEEALRSLQPVPAEGIDFQADIIQVKAYVGLGRYEHALRRLSHLETSARHDALEGLLVEASVQQALCHDALGKSSTALKCLGRAMSQADATRYRAPLVEHAERLAGMSSELRGTSPELFAGTRAAMHDELPETLAIAADFTTPLNPRDVELLQLLNRGMRNREIAEHLSLTLGTTKQYLNQLFSKLGARNRIEAILLARHLQVIG